MVRAFDAILGRHAGIHQRQFDVVQRAGARQQVEGLEDEADLFVADARQLVVVHLAHLLFVQQVGLAGPVIAHQLQLSQERQPLAGGAEDQLLRAVGFQDFGQLRHGVRRHARHDEDRHRCRIDDAENALAGTDEAGACDTKQMRGARDHKRQPLCSATMPPLIV